MVPMPHDGKVLSILVRLHLIGKQVDVKKHLKELEIRAEVVVRLFRELVSRGFPGYVNYRIDDVEQRTRELFGDGPRAGFVPKDVLEEVARAAQVSGRRQKRVVGQECHASRASKSGRGGCFRDGAASLHCGGAGW